MAAAHAAAQALFEEIARRKPAEPLFGVKSAPWRSSSSCRLINAPLLQGPHNVYGLAWGMARHLGVTTIDFPEELMRHVAGTLGQQQFGVPRVPPSHELSINPITAVRAFWPATSRFRDDFCDTASQWPILYGLAAQRAIEMSRQVVDPVLAARIVVECAVPMSKLDPGRVLA